MGSRGGSGYPAEAKTNIHPTKLLLLREPVSPSCWEEGKKKREYKDGKEKSVYVDLCDSLSHSLFLGLSLSLSLLLYESVSHSVS